jgi:hypothetical protein
MLLVSESVALYRGFARIQDRRYPDQEQQELHPATRKNQDNGYHTFNINCKKRRNCQLTLRASYCTAAAKKKPPLKTGTTQLASKTDLNQRPEKNQSNGYHSFDITCKKRHNSMVYRSICYVGQLRPHHPPPPLHTTQHPDSTTAAKRDGLAGNRTPDHSHAKGVLYH